MRAFNGSSLACLTSIGSIYLSMNLRFALAVVFHFDFTNRNPQKPYFKKLAQFLAGERKANKTIYPPEPLIFNALNLCPFDAVNVVIIGQDPYHGADQAHGLAFSVRLGKTPP